MCAPSDLGQPAVRWLSAIGDASTGATAPVTAAAPGQQTTSKDTNSKDTANRPAPWRLLGIGASTLPGPVALSLTSPRLGLVLFLVEIGAVTLLVLVFGMTLLIAILRGSNTTTERCFRLLRWIANRSEHPGPNVLTP
jgi:hypothetical protein